MKPSEIKVGDKLWFVPSHRRGSREVVVKKVGRKFADIGELRLKLDVATMVVRDAKHSYGVCHRSEDEYLSECMRVSLQVAFIRNVEHAYSIKWTVDQINEAAKVLGVKLPEPPK